VSYDIDVQHTAYVKNVRRWYRVGLHLPALMFYMRTCQLLFIW